MHLFKALLVRTTIGEQTVRVSSLVDQFNVTLNPTQQLNDTLFTASDRALAVLLPSNRHLFVSQLDRFPVFGALLSPFWSCEVVGLALGATTRQTTLLSLATSLAIVQAPSGKPTTTRRCNLYLPSYHGCDGDLQVAETDLPCDQDSQLSDTVLGHQDLIITKVHSQIFKYHVPTRTTQPLELSFDDDTALTAVLTPSYFVVQQACDVSTADCASIAIIPFGIERDDAWLPVAETILNSELCPPARVHAIAACEDSIQMLAFVVSHSNGSDSVLELRVLKRFATSEGYTQMAAFPIDIPSASYGQVQLACNAAALRYMVPTTTGQWYQQHVTLLDTSIWQPYPQALPLDSCPQSGPTSAPQTQGSSSMDASSTGPPDGPTPTTPLPTSPELTTSSSPETTPLVSTSPELTTSFPASTSPELSRDTTPSIPPTLPVQSTPAMTTNAVTTTRLPATSSVPAPRAKHSDVQLPWWLGLSLGVAVVCSMLTAACCWHRQLRARRLVFHHISYYSTVSCT